MLSINNADFFQIPKFTPDYFSEIIIEFEFGSLITNTEDCFLLSVLTANFKAPIIFTFALN